MKDSEVASVHINSCVRDSELREMREASDAAEPGEWYLREGRITRHDGTPVASKGSLNLMARARGWIPRLVRGIEVLEESLASSRVNAASFRRELLAAREQHVEDLKRAHGGETGPEYDLDVIVEAVQIGAMDARYLKFILGRWAKGESTQAGLHSFDIERARARVREEARIREEVKAEAERDRAEVRALLAELRLTKREREAVAANVRAALKQP